MDSTDGRDDLDRGRATDRRRRSVAGAAALVLLLAGCGSDGSDAGPPATTSTTTGATDAGPSTTSTTAAPVLEAPDHPWVVGHRGAAGLAPENTFASFDRAVEAGADVLELDLQLTSDGELVVLHDPALDRTARGPAADCTGTIDTRTLAQVQGCDAGTWFNEERPEQADPAFADQRIPTLAEVLDRYGPDVRWYLETKKLLAGEGMEEALVAVLEEAGFTADAPASQLVIVQSFDAESLRTVAQLRPDLALAQLLTAGTEVDGSGLAEVVTYADGIAPNAADVDAELVDAAHEACLTVIPYTVDDPAEMGRLLDLGVDGLITNRPDVLRPLVADRTSTPPCDGG